MRSTENADVTSSSNSNRVAFIRNHGICKQVLVVSILATLIAIATIVSRINGKTSVDINSNYLRYVPVAYAKRLQEYCSLGLASGSEKMATSLPELGDDSDRFVLKYLLLTIRHGDRSAIHNIPGSAATSNEKIISSMPKKKEYLDPKALQFAHQMSYFRLESIVSPPSKSSQKQKNLPKVTSTLPDSLNSSTIFNAGDFELEQGQLTTRGFMQHIHLGSLLRKTYSSFLNTQIKSVSNLYVRSTNYDRTIQSVAALLTALLPNGERHSKKMRIPVLYHIDESEEIMHGVGAKLSSHTVGSKGETVIEGSCVKAVTSAAAEKASFIPSKKDMTALQGVFGKEVDGRFITDLVDAALPPMCHGQPLPCAASSPASCLPSDLLANLMHEADRAFCYRYTGVSGGANATKLATYPFMQEILLHIRRASTGGEKYSDMKLSIFSGHDTVIAPVLAGLGVYTNELCVWPPYASSIIFELWQDTKSPKTTEVSYKMISFVRVLYNGKDITSAIPACRAEKEEKGPQGMMTSSIRKLGNKVGLCSVEALERQVEGMIAPSKDFKDACQIQ